MGEPTNVPAFACVSMAHDVDGEFCLDLRYEQRWYYRRAAIGALSASVALAPAETLSLSVRNTQRKQFDQQTVDEVERSQQTESTLVDKDVLNVTRSASKTNNWSISGNASISIPKLNVGLGVSGSTSQTVTQASSSSAQRTRESAEKAASNLKTLHKVQVREFTEVTAEAATVRKITNPYRDRSLRLDVYELIKDYCVEFHLVDVVPTVILNVDELKFDRDFVLNNGGFLADELIDRVLELELSQALQTTKSLPPEGAVARAQETALRALDYLFAGPGMFNWPPGSDAAWGTSRPNAWDENDPGSSFQEPLAGWSGLRDATAVKLSVIFSTLAFYYQLYFREVLPAAGSPATARPDGRLAVEIAMSLDQALAPRWIGVEEAEDAKKMIDWTRATEVYRRLGGFLTMTSGILRPLLQPAEEELEARTSAERAEWVITRVVEHLRCHARYYTERYVHYMADRTRMRAVSRFAERVLQYLAADPALPEGFDPAADFDPEAAFLDGSRIVIPIRIQPSREELDNLIETLDKSAGHLPFGLLGSHELTVPTDGVHIEPAAGTCLLPDIPAEPVTEPVHLVIEKE